MRDTENTAQRERNAVNLRPDQRLDGFIRGVLTDTLREKLILA
jgi:hypothetical protein